MASTKKIFTRTVTVERLVAYLPKSNGPKLFCKLCEPTEPLLTIADVRTKYQMPLLVILKACESSEVHFVETDDLEILICPTSITRFCNGVIK